MKATNDKLTRMRDKKLLTILRSMVVDLVPIFLVGISADLLTMIPVQGYQVFINSFAGGIIYKILYAVYFVTFGVQSAHVLFFYTRHICLEKSVDQIEQLGEILSAISMFCIFLDVMNPRADLVALLGPRGMFVAFLAILFSFYCYELASNITKKLVKSMWVSNIGLSVAVRAMIPISLTVFIGVIFNYLIGMIGGTGSVSAFIRYAVNSFFERNSGTVFGEIALLLLSTVLWFFGIHGTKAIEEIFNTVMAGALAGGNAIFTKAFITTFVLVGGCGAALCLVIAYIIVAKKRKYKIGTDQKVAFGISLFNINEFIVFGLPVIYNKMLLVPFLTVPVVFYATAYAATYYGFIPKTSVEEAFWVTPIFISGYLATGTIRGVLVQLFNLMIGTAIYYPFVDRYIVDKQAQRKDKYKMLLDVEKRNEAENTKSDMVSVYSPYAEITNSLQKMLRDAIAGGRIPLHYQPQYDEQGKCIGAEALLRVEHPEFGFIYPPLLIEIARQGGFLENLEQSVVRKVLADAELIHTETGNAEFKVSANVTGETIQSERFEAFLTDIAETYDIESMHFILEVTEQDFLKIDELQRKRFNHLREQGYRFAIDDFSMGSTSVSYLTGNLFDAIKLDGSLITQISENRRAVSIVNSVIELSKRLNMRTFAEYVSNETILNKLKQLGCDYYQGWYFTPAMPVGDLIELLKKEVQ